ncbi:MAG TPA: hypothetical protein VMZ74_12295 [Ramlibacter sp.]|nr:hypothetical protein [Ramlibacter sp.]
MNSTLRIPLNMGPEEAARLRQLQAMFAKACNALAPLVQKTKVWNRVALHHMAYKPLRIEFPQMGSQMVCNAIYSVSRHSRLLYQSPASPFNVAKLGDKPLPLLQFTDRAPVYFDRHTLSIKSGRLSMFTLDGRLHFNVGLSAEDEAKFHELKLREVALTRAGADRDRFELAFVFSDKDEEEPQAAVRVNPAELPEYMLVEEAR